MPEVAICKGNIVIPALGTEILFKGERQEYLQEYLVQHLSVCMPLLIHPLLRTITGLEQNRQESDRYDTVH
jgi:hypothetical protein